MEPIKRAGFSRLLLLVVGSLTALTLPYSSSVSAQTRQEIQNLRAFAKLYGYVKYFHPSDEASEIDWDRFAAYGASKTKDAGTSEELQRVLEQLFLPIAPTVQVYRTGQPPTKPAKVFPKNTVDLQLVAWQHFGVGLGGSGSIYRSIRLNRQNKLAAAEAGFGTVTQGVSAVPHRGKQVKLKAYVKADVTGLGNQGQLWLRVDREGNQRGFFNNMADRPITSSEWAVYEIVGTVADDAQSIVFGCFLLGTGQVGVDEFELLVGGESGWEQVEIRNPGFEAGNAGARPPGWGGMNPGYKFSVSKEEPFKGRRSLTITDESTTFSGELFARSPRVDEVAEKDLGAGLSARIPLALYSDSAGTLPRSEEHSLEALQAELNRIDLARMTADDRSVRLADVIIAWNVFQHFYPYFDVVDTDWDAELMRSLSEALSDEDERDFLLTLRELVANLHDGHGNVFHARYSPRGKLPFLVDWIEGHVVVTYSVSDSLKRGDVVLTIDGVEAERALVNAEKYISGSPQWKRFRALQSFGDGEVGTEARLKVKRGNESLDVQVERRQLDQALTEPRKDNIELLEDGVYYVNLNRAQITEIMERIDDLAAARGVIFDLRGYPAGNHAIISHLLESADTSDAWMRIPQIIYPDYQDLAGFRNSGWGLPVSEPHIGGTVVFMTDGRAISYAESFLGFIEHYKLAEIVGQPTAGTNGNVNLLMLPGGFRISWTGMKVVKHDGSQHHLVGILPTVYAERTIQGVIDGGDEYLEVALGIIDRK